MIIRRLLVLSAATLATSTVAGYAGPCSNEIDRMQARIDAGVEAVAPTGPSAPESPGALLHRQPTPGSIAAVEVDWKTCRHTAGSWVEAAMARRSENDAVAERQD